MKHTVICVWFLTFVLSVSVASADEENLTPPPTTSDSNQEEGKNTERQFNSDVSETIPDPVSMPKATNSKGHHKQKVHLENGQSHRSPVYDVVSQPCYSYSCKGYGQPDFRYPQWPNRGNNRFVPYPQSPAYEQRRNDIYPPVGDPYQDSYYRPREPDYGFGPGPDRSYYPQGRYGGYGRYNQPAFGGRFVG